MTGGIEWGITQGARLKALRLRKGFTQLYVAAKIHYTTTSLKSWESGKIRPSMKAIHDLAFLYNVPIEYITEGVTDGVPNDVLNPSNAVDPMLAIPTPPIGISTPPIGISIISNNTLEVVRLMAKLTGKTESEIIDVAVENFSDKFYWRECIHRHYFTDNNNNTTEVKTDEYSEEQ